MKNNSTKNTAFLTAFLESTDDNELDTAANSLVNNLGFPEGRSGLGYLIVQLESLYPHLLQLDKENEDMWLLWKRRHQETSGCRHGVQRHGPLWMTMRAEH